MYASLKVTEKGMAAIEGETTSVLLPILANLLVTNYHQRMQLLHQQLHPVIVNQSQKLEKVAIFFLWSGHCSPIKKTGKLLLLRRATSFQQYSKNHTEMFSFFVVTSKIYLISLTRVPTFCGQMFNLAREAPTKTD